MRRLVSPVKRFSFGSRTLLKSNSESLDKLECENEDISPLIFNNSRFSKLAKVRLTRDPSTSIDCKFSSEERVKLIILPFIESDFKLVNLDSFEVSVNCPPIVRELRFGYLE